MLDQYIFIFLFTYLYCVFICCRIIPKMFHPSDQNMHNPLIASAKDKTANLLDSVLQEEMTSFPVMHAAIPPFDSLWKSSKEKNYSCKANLEGNLTRILNLIAQKLVTSTSRHLTVRFYLSILREYMKFAILLKPFIFLYSLVAFRH